jgi:pimeloyl-ACP methyl ester carboxylesterase
VEAKFITAQDPVIQTANGGRLPAVPIEEATKLNKLRDRLDDRDPSENEPIRASLREAKDGTIHGVRPVEETEETSEKNGQTDAPLSEQKPPSRTNPLFPPLPMYGPPTWMRRAQCWAFRFSSGILSFCFLLVIILGAGFTSVPLAARYVWLKLQGQDPNSNRPFHQEEQRRDRIRKLAEREWQDKMRSDDTKDSPREEESDKKSEEFVSLEGGPDRLICDIRYYARRVGLDCEVFDVQTEDGFIIELWHLYNPRQYHRATSSHRSPHDPEVFPPGFVENGRKNGASGSQYPDGEKKYPVLMIHGLLQSAGAYCTNDDDSLAFFLAKSGYDVWLGNNRCGFRPRHNLLDYNDPRMWAWNIRQMGVMDLPALISRVLSETGFEKLGLIAHSQGTTQTFVALAKEQRPDIGEKISVFCALAPAAYAGPLIGKMYFRFMRVISPVMFRVMFGIHSFIPFMMTMHSILPGKIYGAMGYRVFSFLFNWSDDRWERGLRDRMFQFSPVYVSAESMRWWLGRECFAKQKCILATREEKIIEDKEDEQEDQQQKLFHRKEDRDEEDLSSDEDDSHDRERDDSDNTISPTKSPSARVKKTPSDRSRFAWYAPGTPPFALWLCGADDLVDGRRLLRRFDRNREPHVDLVHAKIIEGYEHLDVIWAMDAIEKVGKEVREVLWKTAPESSRKVCRAPKGCEDVQDFYKRRDAKDQRERAGTELDASAGEWSEKGAREVSGGGGEGDRNLEEEIRGAS